MNRLASLLSAALVIAGPIALSADGIIGQDILTASAGYAWSNEEVGGYAGAIFGAGARTNLLRKGSHGLDMDAELGYLKAGLDDVDADLNQVDLTGGLTYFYDSNGSMVPFVSGIVGYRAVDNAGIDDNTFVYGVGLGVEIFVSPGFSIIPEASILGLPDMYSDYSADFSLTLCIGISENMSLLLEGGIQSTDSHDTGTFTVGFGGHF